MALSFSRLGRRNSPHDIITSKIPINTAPLLCANPFCLCQIIRDINKNKHMQADNFQKNERKNKSCMWNMKEGIGCFEKKKKTKEGRHVFLRTTKKNPELQVKFQEGR